MGKTSPSLPFLHIAACMCFYVCICSCMCVCMRVCMCVCMCAYVHVCVFVCVSVCASMAAVHVLVCVPGVFLLCLLRCPTYPTTGKTSPSLPFLHIEACMCLYVCKCVCMCLYVCLYVCICACWDMMAHWDMVAP